MKQRSRNTLPPTRVESIGKTLATVGFTALALGAGFATSHNIQADTAREVAEAANKSGDDFDSTVALTQAAEHSEGAAEAFTVALGGAVIAAAGTAAHASKKR